MVKALGTTTRLLWYAIQGCVLALLSVAGVFFLAGRLGYVEPISAYVIQSGSMTPAIPVGGVIIVQRQLFYGIGDIITFTQGKSAVTHRISDIEEASTYYGDGTFTTKGDANKVSDTGTVSQADVQGRVLFALPYLGYIVEYAKSPKGFLAFIIIPATIIIYEELKNVRKEIARALRGLFVRFKKPEEETAAASFPKAIVVPVVAAAFLFAAVAKSYFLDSEVTQNNFLRAAASYELVTPTPIQSGPTPTPSPGP